MNEDLLKLLGFEKPEDQEDEVTIDQVRDHVNSHFVPVNEISDRKDILEPIINKSIGQRLGSIQTAVISHAKNSGLDVTHKDFEGKKVEEILPEVFGRFKEKIDGVKKPDTKLEKELEGLKADLGTYKSTIEELESKNQALAEEYKQKEQGWLINHAKNQAWESVSFSPEVDELKKIGFKSQFESKYDLKTDDSGNVVPVYKDGDKKGSRVQNPTKLSEHLGLSELLKHEATQLGLIAKPNEGKKGGKSNGGSERTTKPEETKSKIPLSPRFAGA